MDGVSPSLREQGMQALRDGEIDRAVDLLARTVIADGQDAEAQALLGVAYSQKGLHAQATRFVLAARYSYFRGHYRICSHLPVSCYPNPQVRFRRIGEAVGCVPG